ncbi:hypothetical protein B0H13DRAFT_2302184 [Mycena leptocephala]|nr:hypothetical protein B0H13DRAFT_2302184 [Mycena leptocephala]
MLYHWPTPFPTYVAHFISDLCGRARPYAAQTYAVRPTSLRLTQLDTSHISADPITDLAARTTRQWPGAAPRALLRLDADERRARSCNPCSPAPRRYNGREMRLVLSHASTIQWLGDAIRALPRLDDTMAGSCASCSPAPRRCNGRELRLVLSRATTIQGLGAALRALPRLDAARTMRKRLGDAPCALPRRDTHDLADEAHIRRRIPTSTPLLNSTFSRAARPRARWLRSQGARQSRNHPYRFRSDLP